MNKLELDLTQQEPIPPNGVETALALMASGKLHRCGEVGALEESGVQPGDGVLSNCFTLAPVPCAIAHALARPVLVDVRDDYTIDVDDLDRKAAASGAKTLSLSHMRGHIGDMDALADVCRRHGVQLIEDCAHTMGAAGNGRPTGTWGRAGCFSLQRYKHANDGEGGLLVADDEDVAGQAIAACAERGLHIKWFGADEPIGFTSAWTHWRYVGEPQSLPQAERVLGGLCDLQLPLMLSQGDCAAIGGVVREVLSSIDRGP